MSKRVVNGIEVEEGRRGTRWRRASREWSSTTSLTRRVVAKGSGASYGVSEEVGGWTEVAEGKGRGGAAVDSETGVVDDVDDEGGCGCGWKEGCEVTT